MSVGIDALVAELAVERDVGVAVDGRDHRGLLALAAEALMSATMVCQSAVAERRVVPP
jgi:hypothetical protein